MKNQPNVAKEAIHDAFRRGQKLRAKGWGGKENIKQERRSSKRKLRQYA